MATNLPPDKLLARFLNEVGQLTSWPAKHSTKLVLLEYIVTKFSFDRSYSEAQVNVILKQWHTFGDWAVLRRALIDEGFMTRKIDGSDYRRLSLDV